MANDASRHPVVPRLGGYVQATVGSLLDRFLTEERCASPEDSDISQCIAKREGLAQRVTIVQGTLAKAFGLVGGYIAASAPLIDFVRSFSPGFIFTSALPPAIAAGALASVRHLKNDSSLRALHQQRVAALKRELTKAELPMISSPSHIVPVLVGNAVTCKAVSDDLLSVTASMRSLSTIQLYQEAPRGSVSRQQLAQRSGYSVAR